MPPNIKTWCCDRLWRAARKCSQKYFFFLIATAFCLTDKQGMSVPRPIVWSYFVMTHFMSWLASPAPDDWDVTVFLYYVQWIPLKCVLLSAHSQSPKKGLILWRHGWLNFAVVSSKIFTTLGSKFYAVVKRVEYFQDWFTVSVIGFRPLLYVTMKLLALTIFYSNNTPVTCPPDPN